MPHLRRQLQSGDGWNGCRGIPGMSTGMRLVNDQGISSYAAVVVTNHGNHCARTAQSPFINTIKIMNAKIDVKSALVGLAVGVVAILALGAASPSSSIGRYRVAGNTPYFLLVDTTTGKVWAGNFQAGLRNTDADFFNAKSE